jgi:Mg2+/Co2+ transporter CorB
VTLFAILLLTLILVAAFFSFAETSLMAVNRYRLRHKAKMKRTYAIRLLHLLKRPDRLLGVILIGSTFSSILASSLATLIAIHFWGDTGAILSAIVLTFVILIFAEIAPKTIAAIYPDKVARLVVYPIQFILKLFHPIVWLANSVTNGLLRLLRIRVTAQSVEPLSREELRSVVYDTAGKISRQYQNMLLSILDLNNLTVDDVMVLPHDMVGIDIAQPWEQICARIRQSQPGWVPVYREQLNQMIGVLMVSDALRVLISTGQLDKDSLHQYLNEPYFVPEGTPLFTQLGNFQQHQDNIAFVVDEYGEIQGALTPKDIMDEIVGDFSPTLEQSKQLQLHPDGSYTVDGVFSVREFNRASQWELPVGGPKTINGLIVEHLEAMPHTGTTVLIAGYPIEITQVKDKRVKLARVYPKYDSEA